MICSFIFHSVKQPNSIKIPSRYFHSPHVLVHTLVLRQPHLTLKMSFQAVNRALLHPQQGDAVEESQYGQCFTVIQSTQIYALVFAGWKKLCQSSPSSNWPSVQGRLRHICPAKVNKILTCTEVMGLNQFPDLPTALNFLSFHTVRFYLRVLQGGVFFCVVEGFEFLSG